ncbi:MAG: hypothetical protein Q7S57_06090 [bacterium]|nr:hypothetical protein [bacterium]
MEFSICGSVRRIKNVVFSATKPTELDSEMVRLAVVRTLVAVGTTVWTDKFYHKLLVGGQGRIICVSQKVIDGETFRGEILTLEPPCGIHWEEGRPVDTGLRGVGVFRPLEESEILEVGHEKLPEKLPA